MFTQEYVFAERCCFFTFSFEGKFRKYDISMNQKHTNTNENMIFSVLFTNFRKTKILIFMQCRNRNNAQFVSIRDIKAGAGRWLYNENNIFFIFLVEMIKKPDSVYSEPYKDLYFQFIFTCSFQNFIYICSHCSLQKIIFLMKRSQPCFSQL